MKKRLISILLTVLMVMSLFSGLSVSAYADDVIDSSYYKEYTMVEGDYVLRICQRMGINYYTVKEAIMLLNNILSENDFRFMGVGTVVKVPLSDSHAIAIMKGQAVENVGSGAATGGVADVKGNASVAYYLVPHAMAHGETVLGVCNALGTNFNDNMDLIQRVNGIKNWNNVHAGSTVLIPVYKTPAVGTNCYAVMNHKVASGETTYGICGTYGISYGGTQKLMQAVNGNNNLAAIKAGSTLKVPVVTTIKASNSTGASGSTDKNNTTTNNNTNNTNNNTSTAKLYELNANINTEHGSMEFYVDNKKVDTAAEGAVVTVVVNTKDSKAVESLIVKHADGRADVKLDSNSFIMPACDVRVDAAINSGYDITIESNYSFKTAAQVDGINTTSAPADKSVKIVSTDPSFEIVSIKVLKSNFLGIKAELPVNGNNSFVMPETDVTVKVELAPVKTYNFYREDCEFGSFDIQVDGNSVSKAAKGAQVTVVWQPASGYQIGSINVYPHGAEKTDANRINVFNNSFTMPAKDVDITVTFIETVNHIEIEAITGAILRATVDGEVVNEAVTGETVTIEAVREEGKFDDSDGYKAIIEELTVTRKADGHRVTVADDGSFKMPAGGVTVTGKVKTDPAEVTVKFLSADSKKEVTGSGNSVTLTNVNDYNDSFTAKDAEDADNSDEFAVGTKIRLSTDTTRDTHTFVEYKVYANDEIDDELTRKANQGQFTMPNKAVTIEAYFSAEYIALPEPSISGNGTASYLVSSNGTDFVSATKAKVGDLVKIVPVSNSNGLYANIDTITVKDKGTGYNMSITANGDGTYSFRMPADGVEVSVRFVGLPHTLTLKTVDETTVKPSELQGKNLWGMYINTQTPSDKHYENSSDANGTIVEVNGGDPIIIFFEKALTDKYVVDRVELTSAAGTVHQNGLEYSQGRYNFFMADEDLTVTVYVKEKASKTHSLLDISYDKNKMTIGCVTSSSNDSVVTTADEGETVTVKAQIKNGTEYMLEAEGITITKKSSDNVGKGTFTYGGENPGTLAENKYYAITDGDKVIGWKYIMPAGGVNVSVACKAAEYNIELTVKDTNGNEADANGTNFNALGYVVLSTTEADVSTARQVSNGIAEGIPFGSAVKISLSEVGASLYKIKSATITGVEIKNNSFWMPANGVELEVVLEAKVVEPETIKLNYTETANKDKGSLQFYGDSALNENLNGSVKVGEDVYIKALPVDGYEVTELIVKNAKDKKEIETTDEGDNVWSFENAPADGVEISVKYEPIEYTLTIDCADSDNNLVQVAINNGTPQKVVNGNTFKVSYGQKIVFSIADSTYKLNTVHAVITNSDGSDTTKTINASSTMPCGDMSVSFSVAKK